MKKKSQCLRNKYSFRTIKLMVVLALLFLLTASSSFAQDDHLKRFPDINGDKVVFSSGEDLWIAPVNGGKASRLTIHDGQERFPKFSPDGKLIAFTGEYDGNSDVYVMDADGGKIKRVTFHPNYDRVVGWHPLKNKIMFVASREHFRFSKLYLISPDGSGLEELIIHNISQGSFSPDGKQLAFNKVSREGRTWKRYKGGTAQEIYLYDFNTDTDKKLTDFIGTDRIPMWIGDKIYFSSDRDKILNIYSVDPADSKVEQITFHKEYDIRRPSAGSGKIVYELAGDIWVLDVASKETKKIEIEISADAPEVRPTFVEAADLIQNFNVSPTGKRALVVARGEIFTVPKKNGAVRNLTMDSGARDKDAVWSPDGKTIAYISDKSGEYEIYTIDPAGKKEAVKLTSHENGYRHSLRWSPDSKKLAYTDNNLTLYVLDIKTKKIAKVDKAEFEDIDVAMDLKPIYDFNWSPDSKFIAYSKMNGDLVFQVYIYSLEENKIYNASSGLFNDFHPVFSKDGKRLFFVSNRRFDPVLGDFEWELVYKKSSGIYALALTKDADSFLPVESDEEAEKSTAEKSDKKDVSVKIDFEGLADRLEALPLPRGNYRYLAAGDNCLFYLDRDEGDFNKFEFRVPRDMDLHVFDFKSKNSSSVLKAVNGYKLSADANSIVYRKNGSIGIISSSEKDSKGNTLQLDGLKMRLDPLAEWKQIFYEAWRMERDFYYEPGMHGLDWDLMKDKYGKLIDKATCRQDVQFIIGELIGELNTSHTYVYGGDIRRDNDRVNVGLLGADYEIDQDNNLYKIKKILNVPGWTREIYPPLAKQGLNVNAGDYILKVNGEKVNADKEIYAHFQNLAGEQVTLLVNDKPTEKDAREVVVVTARGENAMRYLDWVETNRQKVDKASNGTIGYIHMPDTYMGSAREFPKYFFGQTRKKGIILDGRFNGGGLDPVVFLQRLRHKPHSYWTRRYSHHQTGPARGVNSHMVCLTNRQAGSGGDSLPFEFRQFGMGPVIGTRTWGGLVGVSMFIGLIDGGGLTAPDYRVYTPTGKWVVENEGVAPDIEIDLDSKLWSEGVDTQLLKGVDVLMKKIKEEPKEWPKHEPIIDDNNK